MKNIAIIPARGGSKRIKNKNIKDFYEKPAISYAINYAKESSLFSEIIVSTDSKEIADIAIEYGAKVPFMRSQENSSDFASTADVLLEVISRYEDKSYDNICCIYPCSMLIKAAFLKQSFKIMQQNNASTVVPVCKYSPPTKWQLDIINQRLNFVEDQYQNIRSQDIKDSYYDAGQFYWLNKDNFLKYKKIWQKDTFPYLIDEIYCQDIDDIKDWEMAEIKYKILNEKNNI